MIRRIIRSIIRPIVHSILGLAASITRWFLEFDGTIYAELSEPKTFAGAGSVTFTYSTDGGVLQEFTDGYQITALDVFATPAEVTDIIVDGTSVGLGGNATVDGEIHTVKFIVSSMSQKDNIGASNTETNKFRGVIYDAAFTDDVTSANSISWSLDSGIPQYENQSFYAATPINDEMTVQSVGTGTATTTHAVAMYAPDHEGVMREYGVNEPVWQGCRKVTNEILWSEDISYAKWGPIGSPIISAATDPLGGNTATSIVSQSASASGLRQLPMVNVGDRILTSWWVRRVSGSADIDIYTGNATNSENISDYVTSEWQRITIDSVVASSESPRFGILLRAMGDEVEVWHPQYEIINGQSDTTTPSEYIKTEATAVTKVFANANGNTVLDNVVTEITGALLDPQPMLVSQDEFTNLITYSNDFTQADWVKSNISLPPTFDQIGLDGGISASYFEDEVDSATTRAYQHDKALSGGVATYIMYIKKDVDTSSFPGALSQLYGDTIKSAYVYLNTDTGEHAITILDDSTARALVIDKDDWWKVIFEHTDTGSNTLFAFSIYPALGTVLGTIAIEARGNAIFANIEMYSNTTLDQVECTAPIFTEASPVTTGVRPTFNASNHNNTDGPIGLIFDYPAEGDMDVLSLTEGAYLKVESDGGSGYQLTLTDQTNSVSLPMPTAPAEINTTALYDATALKMQLKLNGQYSLETTYDGSFGTGDLVVGATARELSRWAITDIATQKNLLDDGFILLSDGTMYEPSNEYGIKPTIMVADNWATPGTGITISGKKATFDGTQSSGASVAVNTGTTYSGLHIASIKITDTTQGQVRFSSANDSNDYLTDGIYTIYLIPTADAFVVEEDSTASRFIGSIEVLEIYPVTEGLLYNNVEAADWSEG